jgi:type I restriction enzyme S subunit
MREWKECKLGNVARLVKDTYKPKIGDHLPYIGLEHIQEQGLRLLSVGDSDSVISQKFHFKHNDILFGKLRPYFRKVIKPNFAGVCSTDIWVVRALADNDQNFIFYFFANQEFVDTANSGDSGTRMPRADWHFVEDTIWQFPFLPEQRAIAGVLSSLDDKIDFLHRQNKTLEGMAEALWRKMFVEEAAPGWKKGKLGDLIELSYGKGLKEEKRMSGRYPVLGSRGIVGYHNDFLVKGPGIVIGRKGTLGVVNYVEEDFFPIDTTYFIKSKTNARKLFFEYFLLKEFSFEEMNSDSAVPGLNREIAESMEFIVPEKAFIHRFNDSCEPFFSKKMKNEIQIRTLSSLRDTLLPKLMSGEVSVKM